MKDKEFLEWLRDRMNHRYGDSLNLDFMLKLQAIINATPVDKMTTGLASAPELFYGTTTALTVLNIKG